MTDWVSIVGAVTGVAALAISIMNYRYAKKIDERAVMLKRDELTNDIGIQLERLPILIKEADHSKTHNLAAKGQFHSGVTVAWRQSITELSNHVATHKKTFDEIQAGGRDSVTQLRKLDHLKKVLEHHVDWLNGCLREDREEVLTRMEKI